MVASPFRRHVETERSFDIVRLDREGRWRPESRCETDPAPSAFPAVFGKVRQRVPTMGVVEWISVAIFVVVSAYFLYNAYLERKQRKK